MSVCLRRCARLLLALVILGSAVGAWAMGFDDLLGEFRQRRSGVCVIYAHALALAEHDPDAFVAQFRISPNAWAVKLPIGKTAYVTRAQVEKSLSEGFSAGEVDNLLTVYSIAISELTGGFNHKTGMLDYGPRSYSQYVGSGKWTLYDDHQASGRKLSDGLARLVRSVDADGRPLTPSTVGFGALDKDSIPEFAELVRKYRLIGIHDFSVSRYDAASKEVVLRNPHNPKVLMPVPLDLLGRIPAGIDFME